MGKVQDDYIATESEYEFDSGRGIYDKKTIKRSYWFLTEQEFREYYSDAPDGILGFALSLDGDFFGETLKEKDAIWGGKKLLPAIRFDTKFT